MIRNLKRYLSILLALVVLISFSLACNSSESYEEAEEEEEENEPHQVEVGSLSDEDTQPTKRPPLSPKPESDSDQTWLVMLYQDADDEILEEDIFTDLNEAERVGSSDHVQIVAQIDRYKGGFSGDGNWTTAKRFFLTQDDDLETINSEEIEDLGEINMADADTLVDFVGWASSNFPADKYVLILSDHGTGWPGGWSDPAPKNKSANILMDGFDDMLYLSEMDSALEKIQSDTDVNHFEMIGFDACLMAHLEVFSSLAPYASYAVASQEVEPAMGWAYSAFLDQLASDPDQETETLARSIIESYIEKDSIIIDDRARAEYLENVYETTDDISPAELAAEEGRSVTLTAVDLSQVPQLMEALNNLVKVMPGINQKIVARARSRTVAFENVFGEDSKPPYIDLGHFVKLLKKESDSPKVGAAVDQIRQAINSAVLAEKHGEEKMGATGISIYFPASDLFESEGSDYETYVYIADRFAGESLWDDFLTFHYTGQPIEENNKPASKSKIIGPGKELAKIDPIELSGDTASIDIPVTLSSTVTGSQVAYIYIFTGRYDDQTGAIEIIDIDYLDSEEVKEEDGVYYPDWGEEGEIPLEFDWQPINYVITDGDATEPALLNPEDYGDTIENAIYTVDGVYKFQDGAEPRFARLFFNGEGYLTRTIVFSGMDDKGSQKEIIPDEGDQFTVLKQWIEANEDEEVQFTTSEAGTLTFGSQRFEWFEGEAPPGDYLVGFIVEDFDGNLYEEYAEVMVR